MTRSTFTADSSNSMHDIEQRVDQLLTLLQSDSFDEPLGCDERAEFTRVIQTLREVVAEKESRLAQVTAQSEALAAAQAEAIVYSAQVIDELECTKLSLSMARAAAEDAANDTQRLADTIFERTHDAVFVFSSFACVACNDNALQLLGGSREDILDRWPAPFESATLEDGTLASHRLRSAYEQADQGLVVSNEVLLPKSDATRFWAEVTMSSFLMKDAGHVLVVVRDITSRKEFEAELRRNRDFLDNIINAVPDQICVQDEERLIVVANDAFCNAHHVIRDRIVGRPVDQLVAAESRDRLAALEDQLLTTGVGNSDEQMVLNSDGTRGVLSVKRSLFADTSGQRYIVSTSRDITEDRSREDRLRLLASVFKGASEGVAILSTEGRICDANPAFLKMVVDGPSPIGRSLLDVFNFSGLDSQSIFRKIAAGGSWAGKAEELIDSNRRRSFWISLSPSSETELQSTRVIALVSDITELEVTQSKLRKQALYDGLTGLANRRLFREHLQLLVSECPDLPFAVCFLDLDDFKHVNDSAGHNAGDLLLQGVARRIEEVLGSHAFVARFGGDEFAVTLPGGGSDSTAIQDKVDELLIAFREPFNILGTEAVVGLS
ncbi:MAG: diguanylate cyclase, partial [Planctomycetales bacterium]|nr:diguanylate cyclase [Planctomycetales bacterium]